MKEKFDDRLNDKIKNLFDNYQEDYQEDNWLALKARIEKKKRKKIIVWQQSLKIAAILIPLSLLASWYLITLNFQSDVVKITEKKIERRDTTDASIILPPKDKLLSDSDKTPSQNEKFGQEKLSTDSISSDLIMKKNEESFAKSNQGNIIKPLSKLKKIFRRKTWIIPIELSA